MRKDAKAQHASNEKTFRNVSIGVSLARIEQHFSVPSERWRLPDACDVAPKKETNLLLRCFEELPLAHSSQRLTPVAVVVVVVVVVLSMRFHYQDVPEVVRRGVLEPAMTSPPSR